MKRKIVMLLLSVAVIAGLVVVGCAPKAAPPPEEKPAPPAEEKPAPPAPPKAEVIHWIGQAALPSGMPVAIGLDELSARITEASGGRLVWDSKPAGAVCPATEEWKAVDKGVLDFCAGGGSYTIADIPFGTTMSQTVGSKLPPLAVNVWLQIEGRDLANKWYEQMGYDFVDIGGFNGLPEGWIHLDKPLKGPGDLKGLKMRCSGDGGAVLARMGVGTVFCPLGEIFENMSRGVIDAYECSNPSFDWDMGLQEAGKYYYLNPTRAPFENYQLLVTRSKWEELPDDLKVIVEDCGQAEAMYYYSRLVASNVQAIQNFKDYGVIVDKLPKSIEEAFIAEANKYLDERMAQFPSLAEVLGSQREVEKMWAELYGLPG